MRALILRLFAVLAGGMAALLTCGETASAADAVAISAAYYADSDTKAMYQELARRFSADHPEISVKLVSTAATYDELVLNTLRGAMTGDLPDVAFHAYNRVQLLADRGIPVDLDPLIAKEPGWSKMGYLPTVLDFAKINGKIYGLPFNTSTPIVYYNADLVRRVGGDPEQLPKTWPEIVALGRKIRALGGDTLGIYFDYFDSAGNWTYIALVESHGGRMMSPDNKTIAFDGPEGMRATKVLEDIGNAGMVDMSRSQAIQAFAAGTMGIFVASTSYLGDLSMRAKDRFDLRAGPFPVPAAEGRLPAGGSAAMIFAKDPAKQAAAWEFVKYATGPIGQTIVVNNTGYMPSNTIAIEDPKFLGDFYTKNPNFEVSIRQLPKMTGWYTFPGTNGIKIADVIRSHLQAVITRQRTASAEMPDMVRDVRALLPN
jgi:multiple sugar transport system substrate-binding protein